MPKHRQPHPHGTRHRYNYGCHCPACRRADYAEKYGYRSDAEAMADPLRNLATMLRPEAERAWRAEAACRGEDPAVMVPDPKAPDRAEREARALAHCARCPVTTACAAFAYDTGALGILAGTTEDERAAALDATNVPA